MERIGLVSTAGMDSLKPIGPSNLNPFALLA